MPGIQDWRGSLFVMLAAICACTDTERPAGVPERGDERALVTVLTGANVIDGTGSAALAAATIVIEGARIACIGTAGACPVPEGAARYDLSGKWITPGLVDAHVHFSQTGWLDGRPDGVDATALVSPPSMTSAGTNGPWRLASKLKTSRTPRMSVPWVRWSRMRVAISCTRTTTTPFCR
jgi:urease alpha subunit